MEMLVTKFSNGKYRNEGELFDELILKSNVKLMGEMIALQTIRTFALPQKDGEDFLSWFYKL